MRSFVSSRCIRIAACAVVALLCVHNVAPAGPSDWIGGIFKSKKAAKQQSPMVNVPNFSAAAAGSAAEATARVSVAAESAARELNQTMARQAVRPSQTAPPIAVRNQTNDQYLAGLLQKAQATPQAKGQFANKFQELRSDFRRTQNQPTMNASDAKGIASWMANGTAAPPAGSAQIANAANPQNEKAVQVAHTDEVNGQSLADWANVPVATTPASAAVADALNGGETTTVEPVVPEQYRNLKIPGLPEDARIMSVQDRLVTPATIPNATAAPTTSLAPPQTAGTIAAPQLSASGVPMEIENIVPQIIDNRAGQQPITNVASGSNNYLTPPPLNARSSTVTMSPPSASMLQAPVGNGVPAFPSNGQLPANVQIIQPQSLAGQGQVVLPMQSPAPVQNFAPMQNPAPVQNFAPMQSPTPQPSLRVSQQATGVAATARPTVPAAVPLSGRTPLGTPVQLSLEQIKSLPPGTKLIPANAAAVAALEKHQQSMVAEQATAATVSVATNPTTVPASTPSAAEVASTASVANQANVANPTMVFTQPAQTELATAARPVAKPTVETVTLPAPSSTKPAVTAATQPTIVPTQVAAVPPAPAGPSQSSIVKDRLNRAFEMGRADPVRAEAEFLDILRYVAKAHDDAEGLDSYLPAFERGLLTLREAQQIQLALMKEGEPAALQLAHTFRSDVSRSFSEGKITTTAVVDAYYLYARQSLMIAIGEQELGSQALYGWGQLCSARSQRSGLNNGIEQGKASILLAAALDANENNWRAHNEMGVIFARQGEYSEAEDSFRRSLAINPREETYNNISKVLDRKGKPDSYASSYESSYASATPVDAAPSTMSSFAGEEKPASTSAQVGAEQPISKESSRRSKVRAFVDRIMGNDQPTQSYQDDDGIPITAQ